MNRSRLSSVFKNTNRTCWRRIRMLCNTSSQLYGQLIEHTTNWPDAACKPHYATMRGLVSSSSKAGVSTVARSCPRGGFAEATRKHFATLDPARGCGYQWWTLDDGSFAALGIHGQMIYIDPARTLVVAINSAWPVATSPERNVPRNEFLKLIAASVDSEQRPR